MHGGLAGGEGLSVGELQEETALWVKCSQCKHRDLSSDPRHSRKTQKQCCTSQVLGTAETGVSPWLAGQLV